MYRLLNEPPIVSVGMHVPERLSMGFKHLEDACSTIKTLVSDNYFRIDPDHLLLKFMSTLALDPEVSDSDYYINVVMRQHKAISAINGTSSQNVGLNKTSFLYGSDYHEVVILEERRDHIEVFNKTWSDIKPIRILTHPVSELTIPNFHRHDAFDEKGIVVVSIDAFALAAQYKKWYSDRLRLDPDARVSRSAYISKVLLPSLFEDHIKIAVFNRYLKHYKAEQVGEFQKLYKNDLVDYGNMIDEYLLKHIGSLLRKRDHMELNIYKTPIPFDGGIYSLLELPKMAITANTIWAIDAYRLPIFELFAGISVESKSRADNDIFNTFERSVKYLKFSGATLAKIGTVGTMLLQRMNDVERTYWGHKV